VLGVYFPIEKNVAWFTFTFQAQVSLNLLIQRSSLCLLLLVDSSARTRFALYFFTLFGGFASVGTKELVKNPPDTRLRGWICQIRMLDELYPTPNWRILSLIVISSGLYASFFLHTCIQYNIKYTSSNTYCEISNDLELNYANHAGWMWLHSNRLQTQEVVWVQQCQCHLSTGATKSSLVNQAAIRIAKNTVFHNCTKHFKVHLYWVRKRIECGEVDAVYISTHSNLVDFLTKSLPKIKHNDCVEGINLTGWKWGGVLNLGSGDHSHPLRLLGEMRRKRRGKNFET
jgi:hypothetical protein